jgi:hypothetical protein
MGSSGLGAHASVIESLQTVSFKKCVNEPVLVAQACNPSYLGGQEDCGLRTAWANSS